jgi:hypothetical protein
MGNQPRAVPPVIFGRPSGVRSEFARLLKDDPRIDRSLPSFLVRAFDLKSVADYAVNPNLA